MKSNLNESDVNVHTDKVIIYKAITDEPIGLIKEALIKIDASTPVITLDLTKYDYNSLINGDDPILTTNETFVVHDIFKEDDALYVGVVDNNG